MTPKTRITLSCAALVAATIGTLAWARVMGETPSLQLRPGGSGSVSLRLTASGPINALSGELLYDSALLTDVSVAPGPGADGFTARGFLIQPGRYRFTLYSPYDFRPLATSQPVVTFTFTASSAVSGHATTTVDYAMAQAARVMSATPADVLSLGVGRAGVPPEDFQFDSFFVNIGWTAARDWRRYE
ncbi:MAG: cohesin domain-containing protein [Candidatus Sumerlaeota bacterium]|nr:cohesin domain-containing protein [Candidatus Sumerlaeota bacterium]